MTYLFSEDQKTRIISYIDNLKPTLMGKFFYHCLPWKKAVVFQNMNLVFGSILTQKQIEKLAICFYSNFFIFFKELIISRFSHPDKRAQKIEIKGEEYFLNALSNKNTGTIFLCGHFGNFELGLYWWHKYRQVAAIHKKECYIIRKPLSIKVIEKTIFKGLSRTRMNIILKNQALKKIRSLLKNNHLVIFPLDQHANIQKGEGISVKFFGKNAGTYRSLAVFAKMTQAPVVPIRCYSKASDHKCVVEFFPPLQWISHSDRKEEIALNTRAYNAVLESFLIDHPEQWNWLHRRWRNDI